MCCHTQKLIEAKSKLNQQVFNVESKLKTKNKKHIGFTGSYPKIQFNTIILGNHLHRLKISMRQFKPYSIKEDLSS
jgi:hypothetical protein